MRRSRWTELHRALRQQLELGQLSDTARASDVHKTSFGNVGDCTILYNIMKKQSSVVCLKTSFQQFVQSYQKATEKRGSKRRKQDTDGLQVAKLDCNDSIVRVLLLYLSTNILMRMGLVCFPSKQVRFFGALFELQHIGLLSRSRKVDSVKMLSLDYWELSTHISQISLGLTDWSSITTQR